MLARISGVLTMRAFEAQRPSVRRVPFARRLVVSLTKRASTQLRVPFPYRMTARPNSKSVTPVPYSV